MKKINDFVQVVLSIFMIFAVLAFLLYYTVAF